MLSVACKTVLVSSAQRNKVSRAPQPRLRLDGVMASLHVP
jgi:hypothetical protein